MARINLIISHKNHKVQIKFAKNHLQRVSESWKTVLLADRSKYNAFDSDGCNYVWCEPGEELRKKKNLCSTVKHFGGRVMLRGCVAASGVGNLHFIEGIMNKHIYANILQEHMKASAGKLGTVP